MVIYKELNLETFSSLDLATSSSVGLHCLLSEKCKLLWQISTVEEDAVVRLLIQNIFSSGMTHFPFVPPVWSHVYVVL